MVWLISFLTVGNIAVGYGLAVYVQRQFGTTMPPYGALRTKKSEASSVSVPEDVAEPATIASSAPSKASGAKAPAAEETKPTELAAPVASAPAEKNSGLPPEDEENVLAGIEEFRSQLAKMNGAAEESVKPAATKAEELAGASN